MGIQDFPDIYALALGPVALGLGHIYQAIPLAHVIGNSSSIPWFNFLCDFLFSYVSDKS